MRGVETCNAKLTESIKVLKIMKSYKKSKILCETVMKNYKNENHKNSKSCVHPLPPLAQVAAAKNHIQRSSFFFISISQ